MLPCDRKTELCSESLRGRSLANTMHCSEFAKRPHWNMSSVLQCETEAAKHCSAEQGALSRNTCAQKISPASPWCCPSALPPIAHVVQHTAVPAAC